MKKHLALLETSGDDLISIPLLPLHDAVIYPFMVIPLLINRPSSIKALEASMASGKQVFFVTAKNLGNDEPNLEELYPVGTITNILQILKLPGGTAKILAEGVNRGQLINLEESNGILVSTVKLLEDIVVKDSQEVEALMRTLLNGFDDYIKLNPRIPFEIFSALSNIEEPGRLADAIAAHLQRLKLEDRQKILEEQHTKKRLKIVITLLFHELELLQVEERLKSRVKTQLNKTQHEFYLNEKLKAIQKELNELNDGKQSLSDLEKLRLRISKAGLSKEALEKALAEFDKLTLMSPISAEATVSRNYLDWLLDLPWKKETSISTDLVKAEKILEEDHYGLEKVKERIIEYLAVQHRVHKSKGPILCLVGPPGVGKTSLGRSIAHATGREFARIPLGGVRDEAEIRGHRRTYIGSMPGKILQKMARVKVKNPLLMLDEVDKIAMDFHGDPASALLEVLDPEQNHAFNDHYLEVDYDLSKVMFVATANSLDIPAPLLDRMEIIRIAGYTEEEKLNIALKYLIPKQTAENGLKPKEISFTSTAILEVIRYYTAEAGVRGLERAIAKICRKVVKKILVTPKFRSEKITPEKIEHYLGVHIYRFGLTENQNRVGQVHGLAWTEIGGDLLTIEVAVVAGKGKTTYTGQLGEVMQESIQAALTVVRSRIKALGIKKNFYENSDIHLHVPEGATPKDGPSAGISMCTALVSALTNTPVRAEVAMTGEITLRGEVLQIGGLKEKLLAALRGGIKTVIIPEENIKDLKELPPTLLQQIEIKPVRWIDEVLQIALSSPIQPHLATRSRSAKAPARTAKTRGRK